MIIVTGGAGFIGSNLVAALEKRGERVVVCDWMGTDDKWRNIAKRDLEAVIAPQHLVQFLGENEQDISAIFHLGAISATTERDVDLIVDTNIRMSQYLWGWCMRTQKPLIYASSGATYGDGTAGFKDDASVDALAKLKPLNAYGWSKHHFDRWVARKVDRNAGGPPQCVGLKFFNVYGPNEYHKGDQRSVAHQVYPAAARGEAFPLFKSHNPDFKDGGQLRDFVWVGDCVKVMLWFLDNPKQSGLFNLGTGKARSFADLATAVYVAAKKGPQIQYRDMPVELQNKYQYFTEADISKLRAAGYTDPFLGVEEGITQYVQKYLAMPDPYV